MFFHIYLCLLKLFDFVLKFRKKINELSIFYKIFNLCSLCTYNICTKTRAFINLICFSFNPWFSNNSKLIRNFIFRFKYISYHKVLFKFIVSLVNLMQ